MLAVAAAVAVVRSNRGVRGLWNDLEVSLSDHNRWLTDRLRDCGRGCLPQRDGLVHAHIF